MLLTGLGDPSADCEHFDRYVDVAIYRIIWLIIALEILIEHIMVANLITTF